MKYFVHIAHMINPEDIRKFQENIYIVNATMIKFLKLSHQDLNF